MKENKKEERNNLKFDKQIDKIKKKAVEEKYKHDISKLLLNIKRKTRSRPKNSNEKKH